MSATRVILVKITSVLPIATSKNLPANKGTVSEVRVEKTKKTIPVKNTER